MSGHKNHLVKRHYFFHKLLLYFGGWFRQIQKYNFDDAPVDSYCINRLSFIVDFYLFYDGAVDLTRSQCTVSDTQVTIKAHGPFVSISFGSAEWGSSPT